jgi:ABC-type glycerol-3-phosphate transport system substrate-binding protein
LRPRIAALTLLALGVAALAAGCGGAADTHSAGAGGGNGSTRLALVAYSTPQVVYDDAVPAFGKTSAGGDVSFEQSYGASGDQSRAVADLVSAAPPQPATRAAMATASTASAAMRGLNGASGRWGTEGIVHVSHRVSEEVTACSTLEQRCHCPVGDISPS